MKFIHYSLLFFVIFIPAKSIAEQCLKLEDLQLKLIDEEKFKRGETNEVESLILSKNGELLYRTFIIEYENQESILSFIDIDFDGKKEVLLKYDSDPTHSTNYEILKINCKTIEKHLLIPQAGRLEIKNNSLYVHYKKNLQSGIKKYCHKNKFFLCEDEIKLTKNLKITKKFNIDGKLIDRKSVFTKKDVRFLIKQKTYLYSNPLEENKTKMYLIKGDSVTLLDEEFGGDQQWYLIKYKGGKELIKWIKSEGIDVFKPLIPISNN